MGPWIHDPKDQDRLPEDKRSQLGLERAWIGNDLAAFVVTAKKHEVNLCYITIRDRQILNKKVSR